MLQFHKITAASNPIYRDLKKAVSTGENPSFPDLFCVAGAKNVLTALGAKAAPHTLFVRADAKPAFLGELKKAVGGAKARWVMVSAALGNSLDELGFGTQVFAYFPKALLTRASFAVRAGGKYALCDAVRDPGNLGALTRNAAAFSLDGLFLYGCAAPWNPKTVRASAGCALLQKVAVVSDLDALVGALDEKGIPMVGMDNAPGARRLRDAIAERAASGLVLAFGNEGSGLSPRVRSACAEFARVPISPKVDSLNVAASSAAAFYELARE